MSNSLLTKIYQKIWSSNWLHHGNSQLKKIIQVKLYRKLRRKKLLSHHAFATDFFDLKYHGDLYNLIDRRLYRYGAFEKHILFLIRDVLQQYNKPVFLDIGCNVGQHSLYAARYAGTVYAFDPYRHVLEQFEHNIAINHIDNICIHPVGMGIENVEKRFYLPPAMNLGMGSFIEDFSQKNNPGPMLTIVNGDEYLRSQKINSFELMKVDVEGFEKYVLQGLKNSLLNTRPIIILEITKGISASFNKPQDLDDVLPANYSYFLITKQKDGFYQLNTFDWATIKSQADILVCPQEKKSLLPLSTKTRDD